MIWQESIRSCSSLFKSIFRYLDQIAFIVSNNWIHFLMPLRGGTIDKQITQTKGTKHVAIHEMEKQ